MSKLPPHAKRVFSGILHDVYQWEQEMYDGSFQTFEGLKRRDAVTVIAVTTDKKILINFETQPGVPAFVSLPGGNSESGDFMSDAKRELEEETGYTSEQWRPWFSSDILYYEKMDWNNHFFIAKDCKKTGARTDDPGEKIETKLVTFEEFVEISQRADFRNGEIKRKIRSILQDTDPDAGLLTLRNELLK